MQKITPAQMEAASEVQTILSNEMAAEGFYFSVEFVANTNQTPGYLLFANPHLKASTVNDGRLDDNNIGYPLELLSSPQILAQQIASDYKKCYEYLIKE